MAEFMSPKLLTSPSESLPAPFNKIFLNKRIYKSMGSVLTITAAYLIIRLITSESLTVAIRIDIVLCIMRKTNCSGYIFVC